MQKGRRLFFCRRAPAISISSSLKHFTFSSSSPSGSSSAPPPPPEEHVSALYSFLNPTLFTFRKPPTPPSFQSQPVPSISTSAPLSATDRSTFESALHASLATRDTDGAWRSFKSLAAHKTYPSSALASALLFHLSSLRDIHNLKRAFTCAILLLDKSPESLSPDALGGVFDALEAAGTASPALNLARTVLRNRFIMPFNAWGPSTMRLSRTAGGFEAFLRVFEENCKIAREERAAVMVPDLDQFNAVLDGCCRDLGSVSDADKILKTMTNCRFAPDAKSFGSLAYLYAWKGLVERMSELERLINGLGFTDRTAIHNNMIAGYVKAGEFTSVSVAMLGALREGIEKNGEDWNGFDLETYMEVAKCFLENGRIKDLAGLVIESQALESASSWLDTERSVGYGIVNSCVSLGWLDKAHSILDEMDGRGASVGLGVYSSILKAYCKERRTAEAAQLVTQINAAGLQLDSSSYDALIDASMSSQDFHSAFSLFREMREARLPELKMSYLTIMTGLMENLRPELMASFLDSVAGDPRVEVATHDWNSIIHAFCKVGRLEDARRTYRRMVFLQFEPNQQTYLSLINGYVSSEKYFSVLMLWMDVKKKKDVMFNNAMIEAFLYALVKGGFFDAAMEVVGRAHDLKIFIDKWRYKQAYMETHKKLKVAKMRRRDSKKKEALVAFRNWVGLNA